jgi:hypothetical protein
VELEKRRAQIHFQRQQLSKRRSRAEIFRGTAFIGTLFGIREASLKDPSGPIWVLDLEWRRGSPEKDGDVNRITAAASSCKKACANRGIPEGSVRDAEAPVSAVTSA